MSGSTNELLMMINPKTALITCIEEVVTNCSGAPMVTMRVPVSWLPMNLGAVPQF